MSYSYERVDRRRSSYGSSSRRTTFGYWLPLAVTVTAATIGIAAWIWSERKDEDDDYDDGRPPYGGPPPPQGSYQGPSQGPPPPGWQGPPTMDSGYPGPPGVPGPSQGSYGPPDSRGQDLPPQDQGYQAVMTQISSAIRRTPSPQQLFDAASRRAAAGMAAAGAAVGGALSSIREEDKDYEDHSRWSEEADTRASTTMAGGAGSSKSQRKRKTVAIVVSADEYGATSQVEDAFHHEHASILSHLPHHMDEYTRLFVLIYSPTLKAHPLASNVASKPAMSITSSYSNIGHEDAQDERPLASVDPAPISSPSPPRDTSEKFQKLYSEAKTLVDDPTMVIPFTTPNGHVHLLRHLSPETVYIQETLSGESGDAVSHISKFINQVIVVVGDETGHGGLVDSEDERGHHGERGNKWWMDSSMIGLGKGIEVVEGMRVGEDWRRRVGGHD